jgi:hypothetical protein
MTPPDGDRTASEDEAGADPAANGHPSIEAATPELDAVPSPAHFAIGTIFRNDQNLREALSSNLRGRTAESLAVSARAREAFAGFSASRYTAPAREAPTYLAPGDELAQSLEILAKTGAEALRTSKVPRSLTLRSTDALQAILTRADGDDDSVIGTIGLTELLEYIAPDAAVGPSQPSDRGLTASMAALEAERRLTQATAPGDDDAANGAPAANGGAGGSSAAADALVRDAVNGLMETVTSPESQLRYVVPSRSDETAVQRNISTFELRAGPSDVTSYHDFRTLQIAFEHVWTEIFDGKLATLGQELYQEYVKLKVFAGIDDGTDRRVDTIEDLSRLMDEIRELGMITSDVTPGEVRAGPGGTDGSTPGGGAGPTDPIDYVKGILDPASLFIDDIGDETVKALLDPAGALFNVIKGLVAGKRQLSWSSFPGPIPGSHDIITVKFEADVMPPGEVRIDLTASVNASSWKGLHFREYTGAGQVQCEFKISNDPTDKDLWDTVQTNSLPLYTSQLKFGTLEFGKHGAFDVRTGFYVLGVLGQRLKDRMRVTFHWVQDH